MKLRQIDSRLRDLVMAFANMSSNFAGVPLAFAFIILLGFNGALTLAGSKHGYGPPRGLVATIASLEARERQRTGIGSLKVRYNRVFGYYIEVTKANLHLVPADYIRRQTTVGGERYIVPTINIHLSFFNCLYFGMFNKRPYPCYE